MIIREARDSDIQEIVRVLKASLGEEQLELSEEIWRYKHIDNPFGKSLVLVAVEDEKIVGVRAFMCWTWKNKHREFPAYRAVDTATHPEHQGKGIFKKLTLQAVEKAKEKGRDFVFNTPNDQSRPGYLKMGWRTAGKVVVRLKLSWFSFWKFWGRNEEFGKKTMLSGSNLQVPCEDWNAAQSLKSGLFTPKSREYLEWRYENNPLQKYEIFSGKGFYLAASIRDRKNIRELRIVECICPNKKESFREVKKIVQEWSLKHGAQVISIAPDFDPIGGPTLKGSFGPMLTTRDLNLKISAEPEMSTIINWSYSLGDLELF